MNGGNAASLLPLANLLQHHILMCSVWIGLCIPPTVWQAVSQILLCIIFITSFKHIFLLGILQKLLYASYAYYRNLLINQKNTPFSHCMLPFSFAYFTKDGCICSVCVFQVGQKSFHRLVVCGALMLLRM